MELNKAYGDYEMDLLKLLDKRIFQSSNGRATTFINQPLLINDDQGNGIWLQPDLVVYDSEMKLVEVYEICSYTSYELNLISLRKDLLDIEKTTKAKAFLAFKREDEDLQVLSLEQVNDEINKRTPTKEKPIKSFSEFYNTIKRICGNSGSDQQFFFRGQPDMKYSPLPSIYRKGRIENENFLYREAIRRNSAEFTEDMSTFDNLVKMQHYELPTRLLDITKNPLVALFFACQKDFDADGEVLVYSLLWQSHIKYFDSDAVCILANLAKRPINFDFDNDESYLVYDIQRDKPNFNGENLKSDAIHDVVCVLPKLNNNRIIKQDGAFFIFGMGDEKKEPAIIKDSPITIVVKAKAKEGILKELDFLGINEASLFPETDKVMKQIKKEYC